MTRDDAIDVLRVLTAAWPNANMGDDTVELWIQFLGTVDADDGQAVAAEMVMACEWVPPLAKFREGVNARRRRAIMASTPALPSAEHETTPESGRAHVAELRRVLAHEPPA